MVRAVLLLGALCEIMESLVLSFMVHVEKSRQEALISNQ